MALALLGVDVGVMIVDMANFRVRWQSTTPHDTTSNGFWGCRRTRIDAGNAPASAPSRAADGSIASPSVIHPQDASSSARASSGAVAVIGAGSEIIGSSRAAIFTRTPRTFTWVAVIRAAETSAFCIVFFAFVNLSVTVVIDAVVQSALVLIIDIAGQM